MSDICPAWYASDNSFLSREIMDAFHSPIIELAQQLMYQPDRTVLDLGCGNGALLQHIHKAVPQSVVFGIDCDPERIAHAHILMPEFTSHIRRGNLLSDPEYLWSANRQFTVAILMPGHLLSAPAAKVERLKNRLITQCRHTITYCYQDWILRHNSLKKLATAVGLNVTPIYTSDLVSTALLDSIK
jgi:SAM-dependent methyltransferase